jgi:hypothetical protein
MADRRLQAALSFEAIAGNEDAALILFRQNSVIFFHQRIF